MLTLKKLNALELKETGTPHIPTTSPPILGIFSRQRSCQLSRAPSTLRLTPPLFVFTEVELQ